MMISDPKRVVITGATGLIGKKLCARLRDKGYQLVIFSRNPAKARQTVPDAAEYVAWSPAENGTWASAIAGVYGVIHLAGEPIAEGIFGKRWTAANKALIRDSRVIGTRGIVNAMAAAQQKPQVFVCASAIGYYGFRDDTPLDEQAPPGSDFVAQVTVAWEQEAARAETLGIRTVRLRTGLLLDPESGVLPQIMLPFRFFSGGPVLPGNQWYSWIHPDDEIGLILLALEDQRAHGPLNATAPEPETNRDFSATLGRVLGSPSWLPVPELSLRLLLGEMADLVVKGQRVLPRKALALGYQFQYPSLEAALRQLLGKPH